MPCLTTAGPLPWMLRYCAVALSCKMSVCWNSVRPRQPKKAMVYEETTYCGNPWTRYSLPATATRTGKADVEEYWIMLHEAIRRSQRMILVTSERTSWSTWHSPEHLTCVGSAVVFVGRFSTSFTTTKAIYCCLAARSCPGCSRMACSRRSRSKIR